MRIYKQKLLILSFGLLLCGGLSCGILFWSEEIPASPAEFDQTGCENPCWNGLQTGVSTRQEIRNVLDTFPADSSQIQIEEGEYLSGYQFIKIRFIDESYRYHPNGSPPIISFIFEEDDDDVVDRIYINDMLIMGQVLDVFGEPDGVILASSPTIHPDYWKKSIHFYYPNIGITVGCYQGTTLSNVDGSPCKSEFSIVSLAYFKPEDYRNILKEEYGDADLALKYLTPYNGLSTNYSIFVATPIP